MTRASRLWMFLAGLMGAEAVIAGALSAHADLTETGIQLIDKAVQYELWHTLALLGIAILSRSSPSRLLTACGALFTVGVILFCGTLYMKGFWEMGLFPMSAPIGGSSFILGWLCLASYALIGSKRTD